MVIATIVGYISYLFTMIKQSHKSRMQGSQPLCLLRRRCLRKDPPAGPPELESDAHTRHQHGGPLRLRRARSPLGHLRSVHEARRRSTAGPLPYGLRLEGMFEKTRFNNISLQLLMSISDSPSHKPDPSHGASVPTAFPASHVLPHRRVV